MSFGALRMARNDSRAMLTSAMFYVHRCKGAHAAVLCRKNSIHVAWSVYKKSSHALHPLQSQHRPELPSECYTGTTFSWLLFSFKIDLKLKVKVDQLPAPNRTLHPANDWPGDL